MWVEMLAAYGESDLLCYPAERPEALVAAATRGWQPLARLAAEQRLGRALRGTTVWGDPDLPKTKGSARRLRAELDAMTPFQLTGVHDLITFQALWCWPLRDQRRAEQS